MVSEEFVGMLDIASRKFCTEQNCNHGANRIVVGNTTNQSTTVQCGICKHAEYNTYAELREWDKQHPKVPVRNTGKWGF